MQFFSSIRKKNNDASTRAGFTLIELLVVISIIALLSSIVLAALTNARARAQDAAVLSQKHQLEIAFDLYYGEHNGYPNPNPGSGGTYCIGRDDCLLAGVPITAKLSLGKDKRGNSFAGIEMDSQKSGNSLAALAAAFPFIPQDTPEIGGNKGFVYIACSDPTPFCPINSPSPAVLISATHAGGVVTEEAGKWSAAANSDYSSSASSASESSSSIESSSSSSDYGSSGSSGFDSSYSYFSYDPGSGYSCNQGDGYSGYGYYCTNYSSSSSEGYWDSGSYQYFGYDPGMNYSCNYGNGFSGYGYYCMEGGYDSSYSYFSYDPGSGYSCSQENGYSGYGYYCMPNSSYFSSSEGYWDSGSYQYFGYDPGANYSCNYGNGYSGYGYYCTYIPGSSSDYGSSGSSGFDSSYSYFSYDPGSGYSCNQGDGYSGYGYYCTYGS